jgi:hypothetical protein
MLFAGQLLHADVELSRLCAQRPCIEYIVLHACLVLYEHASLERVAHMFIAAADFMESSGSLACILKHPSPWQRVHLPGRGGDTSTTQLRQLALLVLLLPQMQKFSTRSFRVSLHTQPCLPCA